MNNFEALHLCDECAMKDVDSQRCSECKEHWTDEQLPEQFSPKSIQLQYMKEQLQATRAAGHKSSAVRALAALALGAAAVCILFFTAQSAIATFDSLAAEVSVLVESTTHLAQTANDIDLQGLADTSESVLEQTGESMQTVSESLKAIDIESLNQSIRDLSIVVSPLARLLGG